ncbi:MAG: 50S ribosomal protein L29 [Chloroflexi bacterium]|nr:50S ribosomal protein L29 [Chloroflexota bacterium]|tara:strand:- start:1064 stop:1267 length:204 start_codon:yes stop_codon:yes gene_type:complete
MEINEIRNLSDNELEEELYSVKRELMNLRFKVATMQLANVNEVKMAKKKIARINTIKRERELIKENI